jgi:hypothetical protein
MFFRLKKSGERAYVQIVENKRVDGAVRQSVIANLGRANELAVSGALASLLSSGAKFTNQVLLINALDEDGDGALSASAKRIGGPLLFGRIWERLGIDAVLADLLRKRAFEFPVERAVFAATLHRLFVSGSDRDCACWLNDYDIPGADGLGLHHFYRGIGRVCVVADRGMISAATIAGLEARKLEYILGARERSDAIVRKIVLEDDDPLVRRFFNTAGRDEEAICAYIRH